MKKILSFILGALLCIQAFAQVDVHVGYLNTNYRSSESGYSYSVKGNGFYAGVGTDVSLPYQNLYFSPALNFNLATYDFSEGVHTTEYFLNAPLHIKYVYPVSNVADLFLSAGPSLLCTLGSKTTVRYGGTSYSENEGGGDFDLTLGLEGGVVLSENFKLMIGYDFGLLNQNDDRDYRVTRNFLHIGVGYIF